MPGGSGWSPTRQVRFRRTVLGVTFISFVAIMAGCLSRTGQAAVPLQVGWAVSPASNTVTIQVTSAAGPAGQQILAKSHVAVSEAGGGKAGRWAAAGGTVQVPVPAGARTSLQVQLTGPQPLTRTVTVTTPAPQGITASGASSGRWLMYTSTPLKSGPAQVLCGQKVTMVASSQLAVTEAATACTASLQLTAQDGEQADVPVTVPARSSAAPKAVTTAQLYCFGQSAGRAVYITIDDGWTPSAQVLSLMHQSYLPITAFLISNAAKENLTYWKEFTAAGGIIGDHTVSHPDLAKVSLSKATSQWKQARTSLGGWLGQTPVMGRPPYGDFTPGTETAAAKGGLTALAGWSAVMTSNGVQTWNGKPLSAGEIVLLHWDSGLGQQLTALLATIRAQHLNPAPLTLASFAGITPQKHSLDGD